MISELFKQKLPIVIAGFGCLLIVASIFKVEDISKLKISPYAIPVYPALLAGTVLIVVSIIMYVWTEKSKSKILQTNKPVVADNEEVQPTSSCYRRIALMGCTTDVIEKSTPKKQAIITFYKSLLEEVQRTPYGINACGAEPMRTAFREYYCEKLGSLSKSQIDDLNNRVRWYWFKGDNRGFNYEPGFFGSRELSDIEERTIREVSESDIVVIFSGRTGTHNQLVQLLKYNSQQKHGVNFHEKPLIILGWFGGSIKKYIDENNSKISWIMDAYRELDPEIEIFDWEKENNPKMLAQRLMRSIERLLQ